MHRKGAVSDTVKSDRGSLLAWLRTITLSSGFCDCEYHLVATPPKQNLRTAKPLDKDGIGKHCPAPNHKAVKTKHCHKLKTLHINLHYHSLPNTASNKKPWILHNVHITPNSNLNSHDVLGGDVPVGTPGAPWPNLAAKTLSAKNILGWKAVMAVRPYFPSRTDPTWFQSPLGPLIPQTRSDGDPPLQDACNAWRSKKHEHLAQFSALSQVS